MTLSAIVSLEGIRIFKKFNGMSSWLHSDGVTSLGKALVEDHMDRVQCFTCYLEILLPIWSYQDLKDTSKYTKKLISIHLINLHYRLFLLTSVIFNR